MGKIRDSLCCVKNCKCFFFLGGERNLLALHDLGDVQIEEIAVENGLYCVFFSFEFFSINRDLAKFE